jgi:hypothetical protein
MLLAGLGLHMLLDNFAIISSYFFNLRPLPVACLICFCKSTRIAGGDKSAEREHNISHPIPFETEREELFQFLRIGSFE